MEINICIRVGQKKLTLFFSLGTLKNTFLDPTKKASTGMSS